MATAVGQDRGHPRRWGQRHQAWAVGITNVDASDRIVIISVVTAVVVMLAVVADMLRGR